MEDARPVHTMPPENDASSLHPVDARLLQAIASGDVGIWDVRHELQTVHCSPQWKRRFGFPEPNSPDSTHFWQCRVHPEDLDPMLAAMHQHAIEGQPRYEAHFRLRSTGSGYRRVHSRGRIVERDAEGRPLRGIGIMIDLTDRPATPREGLSHGPRGVMAGQPIARPFHQLLLAARDEARELSLNDAEIARERQRLLSQVEDLLREAVEEWLMVQRG